MVILENASDLLQYLINTFRMTGRWMDAGQIEERTKADQRDLGRWMYELIEGNHVVKDGDVYTVPSLLEIADREERDAELARLRDELAAVTAQRDSLMEIVVAVQVMLSTLVTLRAEEGPDERFVRKLKGHLVLTRGYLTEAIAKGHVDDLEQQRRKDGEQARP